MSQSCSVSVFTYFIDTINKNNENIHQNLKLEYFQYTNKYTHMDLVHRVFILFRALFNPMNTIILGFIDRLNFHFHLICLQNLNELETIDCN